MGRPRRGDGGEGARGGGGVEPGPVAARTGTAWALAGLVSYLSLVHSRFLPAVGLLLVVLAWWAWRARPRSGVLVVAAGAAGALGGVLVNRWVEDAPLRRGRPVLGRRGAARPAARRVHDLPDPRPRLVRRRGLGRAHRRRGAVGARGPALAEVRRRSPGPATVLLLLVLAQLLVGAFYLSTRIGLGAGRLDQVVYGRYMDPVWALLAVVGLAALASDQVDRATLRRAVVVVLVLGAAVGVVLLAVGGIVAGLVQLNVPGIEMWRWEYPPDDLRVPFVQATARRGARAPRRRLGRLPPGCPARSRAVVCALAVTGTFVAEHRTIDARDQRLRDLFSLREVGRGGPDRPRGPGRRPARSCSPGTAFQYWLGDRDYRLLDPAQEAVRIRAGELVIGTLDPRPLMIGAPRGLVAIDPTNRYGVWKAEGGPTDPDRR